MERETIIERLAGALKDGATLSGLELEARTGSKPEELLPILKALRDRKLIFVARFLPHPGNQEEWKRFYCRAAPLFIKKMRSDSFSLSELLREER